MPLLFQNPGRRFVKQINGGQPQTRREAIALAFDLNGDRFSKALFRGCKAMPLTCLQTDSGPFWNSIKASWTIEELAKLPIQTILELYQAFTL